MSSRGVKLQIIANIFALCLGLGAIIGADICGGTKSYARTKVTIVKYKKPSVKKEFKMINKNNQQANKYIQQNIKLYKTKINQIKKHPKKMKKDIENHFKQNVKANRKVANGTQKSYYFTNENKVTTNKSMIDGYILANNQMMPKLKTKGHEKKIYQLSQRQNKNIDQLSYVQKLGHKLEKVCLKSIH